MILTDPRDIAFAKLAPGAKVDGATLPSGLKVPVTAGSVWTIDGSCIRCTRDPRKTMCGMARMILTDPRDIAFAKLAPGAQVDGATLPSGLKVPVTDGSTWVVCGTYIRCISEVTMS